MQSNAICSGQRGEKDFVEQSVDDRKPRCTRVYASNFCGAADCERDARGTMSGNELGNEFTFVLQMDCARPGQDARPINANAIL